MANQTIAQLPVQAKSFEDLRPFLIRLVEKLDILFGYRGDTTYATEDEILKISELLTSATGSLEQAINLALVASKEYTDEEIAELKQEPETTLDYTARTISEEFDQIELQALADDVASIAAKVDSIITKLNATIFTEVP